MNLFFAIGMFMGSFVGTIAGRFLAYRSLHWSWPRCSARESGGAWCERRKYHLGRHKCPKALQRFNDGLR